MPIRKTNDQQKEDWIKANKDFVKSRPLFEVYEKMQQDGLYAITYTFSDAYRALERRIERAFSKKKRNNTES
jgi:hypothetical protein